MFIQKKWQITLDNTTNISTSSKSPFWIIITGIKQAISPITFQVQVLEKLSGTGIREAFIEDNVCLLYS